MKISCISCGTKELDKDVIGINKKFLGTNIKNFFCIECLADYLDVTIEDLNDKIEMFKEQGCILFK